MAISVECDACGTSYRVKDEVAGKRIKCKDCGETIRVPDPAADVVPASVPRKKTRVAPVENDEEEELPPIVRQRPATQSKKRSSKGSSAGNLKRVLVIAGAVVGGVVVLFFGAALLLPALQAARDAMAWKDFSPPEGRFHVVMPGTPKRELAPTPGAPAAMAVQYFKVEVQGGRKWYSVGFLDMSKIRVPYFNTEGALKGARDGVVQAMDGKVISESRINIEGHPGIELEMDVPAGTDPGTRQPRMQRKSVSRIYMVNRCLYALEAGGADLTTTTPDVQRFLTSFTLVPGTAPPSPDPVPPVPVAGAAKTPEERIAEIRARSKTKTKRIKAQPAGPQNTP